MSRFLELREILYIFSNNIIDKIKIQGHKLNI